MIIVEGHIRVCALEWVCIYVSEIRRCLPAFVSVISSLDRCLRKGSKFTWGTTVPLREVCVCVCRYCRYSTYICGSLTASMCVSVEVCLCNCSVCAGTGTWVCVCVCVCVCTPKVCASVCLGGVTCPSGSQWKKLVEQKPQVCLPPTHTHTPLPSLSTSPSLVTSSIPGCQVVAAQQNKANHGQTRASAFSTNEGVLPCTDECVQVFACTR